MPSWNDFEPKPAAAPATPNPARDRYNELCASVFTTPIGRELLTVIRSLTIERRTRPAAPEAELREMEAIRRFVAELERARDLGLELLAKGAKPKP